MKLFRLPVRTGADFQGRRLRAPGGLLSPFVTYCQLLCGHRPARIQGVGTAKPDSGYSHAEALLCEGHDLGGYSHSGSTVSCRNIPTCLPVCLEIWECVLWREATQSVPFWPEGLPRLKQTAGRAGFFWRLWGNPLPWRCFCRPLP